MVSHRQTHPAMQDKQQASVHMQVKEQHPAHPPAVSTRPRSEVSLASSPSRHLVNACPCAWCDPQQNRWLLLLVLGLVPALR
jgi:hypothetical protein